MTLAPAVVSFSNYVGNDDVLIAFEYLNDLPSLKRILYLFNFLFTSITLIPVKAVKEKPSIPVKGLYWYLLVIYWYSIPVKGIYQYSIPVKATSLIPVKETP